MTRSILSIFAAAALALSLLPACVRRTIEITSEPPGALVWLNQEQVGRTPCETDFKFYGVYDVRLALDGYDPIATSRDATAPFYEYPGPDLIAAPFPIHNQIAWHFVLTPALEFSDKLGAERDATERARALRATMPPITPDSSPNPAEH
ncbi:hypothetical protein BH11PLA1_BH11PLA1_15690 [soil metagenome]